MSVIANTTVISNFASITQLDVLHQLYGTLSISVEVYEEIQTGLEEGTDFIPRLSITSFRSQSPGGFI